MKIRCSRGKHPSSNVAGPLWKLGSGGPNQLVTCTGTCEQSSEVGPTGTRKCVGMHEGNPDHRSVLSRCNGPLSRTGPGFLSRTDQGGVEPAKQRVSATRGVIRPVSELKLHDHEGRIMVRE
jgi:hypothetical protein